MSDYEQELDAQWHRLKRVLLVAAHSGGGGEPVSVHCGATPLQIGVLWGLVCSKVDKTIVAMFDNQEAA